jgi:TRAP-type C4-dicarboxylate transport system substrate-binding protein
MTAPLAMQAGPSAGTHRARRKLLLGAAASLGLGSVWAQGRAITTLKFHTFMSPQSNVWLSMHKPWMDLIEKDSGGQLRFEPYPSMQLGGSPAQLYDQVKDGVVDVAWTLPGYTAGRFPRGEVFELPFMMSDAQATSRAFWEYIQTAAPDEFKDVRVLALHVHGPGVIHTVSRPVRAVADLRGLKLRGPTRLVTRLLAALDAVPVGIPLPGIPDALSKGTIDGCVIPWEVVPSIRVHELVRHHTEFAANGGSLYTNTFILAMNQARYAQLPGELRSVIDRHSGPSTSAWLGKTQQANDALGRQEAVKRGNTIHTLDAVASQEFRRRARPLELQWAEDLDKRGFDGKGLLARARQLIDQHSRSSRTG